MTIEGVEVLKSKAFYYLVVVAQRNFGIKEYLKHKIKSRWLRWKIPT